jgi:Putative adhesin
VRGHRWLFLAAVALSTAACGRRAREDTPFRWTSQLAPGSVVHLRDGFGNITVRRAAGTEAVVTGMRQWRRSRPDLQFAVNQDGQDYYICAMWRGSGKCAERGYRGRRTGGFLSIFSLFHRSSDATATIVAELPPDVAVDAQTTVGSVDIDGVTGGVTAHSTNGTVQAYDVSGPLSLSTTNGNVRLTADSLAPTDAVTLTTTNGTVRAALPASLQGTFDLSTVNGSVRSDFPIPGATGGRVGRHLEGQIGQSSRPVKLHAVNGTVTLMTRGAPAAQ